MKPCAESCERNQQAILEILQGEFASVNRVLEIGSGTGQHAAYFAPRLPHVLWQPSDLAENHDGIRLWVAEVHSAEIPDPIELDVSVSPWPELVADSVFSANTAHIMSWPAVVNMFDGVGALLPVGGRFCLYGPFNEHGEYSSDSNGEFDGWLKLRDKSMGLRDIDDLKRIAADVGLELLRRHTMPANNQILVFARQGDSK